MWTPDPIALFVAVLLDFLIGDPRKIPHITRFTGWCIIRWERLFRALKFDTILGGALFYIVVICSLLISIYLVHGLLAQLHPILAMLVECLILYQCIAFRDLITHVRAVIDPLKSGKLDEARQRVSWIVGRDTGHLDEPEISRAAIEALAESMNDGVFAPLFWGCLLGPAGALVYRVTNTLDSMVGHRDIRYERFGKVSARMDDLLGIIPARICALLIWIARPNRYVGSIIKDARKHKSPNAGWPEATIAWGLNIRLGGINYYNGKKLSGPIFNELAKPPEQSKISEGIGLCHKAYAFYIVALALPLLFI